MGFPILSILVLLIGSQAYHSAKRSSAWSNKALMRVMFGATVLIALIAIAICFISQAGIQAHVSLILFGCLFVITAGVSITIYANRSRKRVFLDRSSQSSSSPARQG
jgi:hypothetical protein